MAGPVGESLYKRWGFSEVGAFYVPEDTFGVGCAGDVVELIAMALEIIVLRSVLKDVLSE